jgi:hypothetical protein
VDGWWRDGRVRDREIERERGGEGERGAPAIGSFTRAGPRDRF